MSSSPRVRKMPPRPKIILPIPGQYYSQPATGMGYVTPMPMTPVSGQPQMIYTNRASEFVFKGIKGLTKSGLSVGEKSVVWLYGKVSSWSRRWFTHIFLVVIVFLYSIAGAMIFVTVEGTNEESGRFDIRKKRNDMLEIIRGFCNNSELASDISRWKGQAANEVMEYENDLYEFFKRGLTDRGQKVWTFWNAVFYCGTIYTTIDKPWKELVYCITCVVHQHTACAVRLISSILVYHTTHQFYSLYTALAYINVNWFKREPVRFKFIPFVYKEDLIILLIKRINGKFSFV